MYTEQYIIIDRKFNNYDDPFFEFMIENKHCQFRHTIYYEEIIFLLNAFQKKIDYKDYDYNEIMGEEYYSGISIKLDWKDTGAFLTFRCTNTGIREAHKVEIEIFIENDEIKEFIQDLDFFVNEKTNKFIWFDLQW